MELLTRTLYLLSTGLLVPVIVLLLILFARSLLLVGRTYSAWLSRLRFRSTLRPLLDRLDRDNVEALLRDADLPPEPRWQPALGRLLDQGRSAAQREKALADFEAGCEEDLATARTMARLGPMLGLMGTLIPMGPALVGLAAGDIAAMAENLQVAFSTTVVGLFVGGIGFAVTAGEAALARRSAQRPGVRQRAHRRTDFHTRRRVVVSPPRGGLDPSANRCPHEEAGGPDDRQETPAATRRRDS